MDEREVYPAVTASKASERGCEAGRAHDLTLDIVVGSFIGSGPRKSGPTSKVDEHGGVREEPMDLVKVDAGAVDSSARALKPVGNFVVMGRDITESSIHATLQVPDIVAQLIELAHKVTDVHVRLVVRAKNGRGFLDRLEERLRPRFGRDFRVTASCMTRERCEICYS